MKNYTTKNEIVECCECCEKELNPAKIVWLELSTKTGKWAKQLPEEESQGCFPFGPACAKKKLKG